ncbi:MAG: TonB-dependent receptor [Bacteroidota bacterium]|nr:TonB-dependent receptor [Bacteroidota bacterium]MDE2645484.1 TonB-dependent receptor [Bacteroidota bacterium]MXW34007.1 TonB-dependent receptor [Rhodothermaceae bacterium]MYE62503.1 TonB-dependent receptor [Rhodothermaceae bacterium]MYJ20816.1 TonB-dependent receptor [Rhodothermaceae bacterium]
MTKIYLMNYLRTLLFLTCLYSFNASAQISQSDFGSISGKIVTSQGNPEELVNVFLTQTSYGTSTDLNGDFQLLSIKPGSYLLGISKVGFQEQLISVIVESGQTTEVNATLFEADYHLNEIVIHGQKRRTIYATRINAPLEKTPVSVNIVPGELLSQQQAISLEDALRNVSGVSKFGSYGLSDNINIRGLDIGLSGGAENYRVNGIMLRTPYSDYVEEVQVLKGPASILYGDVEPGGIINYVSKKPKGFQHRSFEMKVGTYGLHRPSIDIGGKLSKQLSYRFNAVYETSESFREGVTNEQFMIAPSLTWNISNRTSLNFEALLMDNEITIDWGMPIGMPLEQAKQLDNSNFYGYPDGKSEGYNSTTIATFEHDFGKWQIRNVMASSNQKRLIHDVYPVYDSGTNSVSYSFGDYKELSRINTFSNFLEFTGQVQTGALRHNSMVAFDFSHFTRPVAYNFAWPVEGGTTLNSPVWENNILSSTPVLDTDVTPFATRFGFNIQDMVSLFNDQLNFLLGGRYSQFTTGTKYSGDADEPEGNEDTVESKFTPRLGLTYELVGGTTLYGSYAESFSSVAPNPGRGLDDPEPLEGDQIEFGVRQSLLDDRFGVTVSYFDLNRKNVLQFEIIDSNGSVSDPGNYRANQSGEHSSRGIEVDINGELMDNWQVYAAFSYFKTEVENEIVQSGDSAPVDYSGLELPNNPNTKLSLWSRYTFTSGIPGLSIGAGIFQQGDMYGDRLNTDVNVIDAFSRVDAMLAYENKNVKLQVNILNLNDVETFQRSIFGSFVPQFPRRILTSFAIKF